MLTRFEAVLGALGWDLVSVTRDSVIPQDAAGSLRPLADELVRAIPQTIVIVDEARQRAPAGFLRDRCVTLVKA